QLRPQLCGLHPHDGIGAGVEIGTAIENLDADAVFFQMAGLAAQRLLDNQPQKPAQAPRLREMRAREDLVQLYENVALPHGGSLATVSDRANNVLLHDLSGRYRRAPPGLIAVTHSGPPAGRGMVQAQSGSKQRTRGEFP